MSSLPWVPRRSEEVFSISSHLPVPTLSSYELKVVNADILVLPLHVYTSLEIYRTEQVVSVIIVLIR